MVKLPSLPVKEIELLQNKMVSYLLLHGCFNSKAHKCDLSWNTLSLVHHNNIYCQSPQSMAVLVVHFRSDLNT